MKKIVSAVVFVATLLVAAAWMAIPSQGGSCGTRPFKPFKPFGCKDIVAQCVCDAQGQNCQWIWVCVKK